MIPAIPTHEGKHYTRRANGKEWHFLAVSISEAYVYSHVIGASGTAPRQDVQMFRTSTEASTAYSQALGAWQRASGLVRP